MRIDAADDLWNLLRRELRVAGIFTLRRKREEEIAAAFEAVCFEPREHFLARRAWIRRRFQHDELSFAQSFRDRIRTSVHERQIGLAVTAERRRDANQNRIAIGKTVEIRRCSGAFALEGRGDWLRCNDLQERPL